MVANHNEMVGLTICNLANGFLIFVDHINWEDINYTLRIF